MIKIEESQFTTIGTLIAGVLGEKEAIEIAIQVKTAGGLQLFDNVICNELWRRIELAIKERKPPWTFKLMVQVEDIPLSDIVNIENHHVTGFLIDQVYLPELIQQAQERRIRNTCRDIADGGETSLLKPILSDYGPVQKTKTKPEIAHAIIDKLELAAQNPGKISGIDTGLIDLNKLTWGWQPQNLIIIGARPSHGKTAMLIGFARSAAIENKIPTLFVTLESSVEELTFRMACQIGRVNQQRMRGGEGSQRDIEALVSAFGKINHCPIYISDCSGKNIGAVQNAIRSFVRDAGIKLVIVDYLQKIKPGERHEKKTYEVAQASEGLKIVANELNVPIISAAQLNREPEKNKGRKPTLADLADSSQIERDADIVGLLHRDEDGYLLLISKFRDGPIGAIKLHFTPEYARFDNADKIDISDYKPTTNDP